MPTNANTIIGRREAYRCLGMSFTSPSQDFFPNAQDFNDYKLFIESTNPDAADAAEKLRLSLDQYSPELLLIEYSRLFVGPFHIPAPPYGSVYLEDGGMVMGQSTVKVTEFYRESGLKIDEGFHDVPDHISVELEFMQYLCHKQWDAAVEGDEDLASSIVARQKIFLETYLIDWVPRFTERMLEGTENTFYAALADNLYRFIEYECRSILQPMQ